MRDCLTGASFTTLLFMIGKLSIGAFRSHTAMASWYGATGSVILTLVCVYYSAIILCFGAEFIKVYAITHGKKNAPNAWSVKIIKNET